MINVAFCYTQESKLHYVQQEITKGFSRRGISIRALPATHPDNLLAYAKQGFFPDILLFSDDSYTHKLLNTFLFLKEQKHSVIFILTKCSNPLNPSIEENCHFLLQPLYETSLTSQQELWNCVCKAYHLSVSDKNTFAYYHRPFYHSTPLNRILYFSSEGRCIRLVTRTGSDSFYGRLSELEECLSMKNCYFIRTHQSYLVNTAFITSYTRKSVTLCNGEVLSISKPIYYQQIKRWFHKK